MVEKNHRFVFNKFVKTCRELDLFWEPDATEGGVTVTAGEPRVLPVCIKKKMLMRKFKTKRWFKTKRCDFTKKMQSSTQCCCNSSYVIQQKWQETNENSVSLNLQIRYVVVIELKGNRNKQNIEVESFLWGIQQLRGQNFATVLCFFDSKCCWKVFPDRLDNFCPHMVQIMYLGSYLLISKTMAILMNFGTYKFDFLNELIFQFSLKYLDSDVFLNLFFKFLSQ